jgi:hypothetical protein
LNKPASTILELEIITKLFVPPKAPKVKMKTGNDVISELKAKAAVTTVALIMTHCLSLMYSSRNVKAKNAANITIEC